MSNDSINVYPKGMRTVGNGPNEGLPSSPQLRSAGYIALIDKRALERECLAHGLAIHNIGMRVVACSSLEDWSETKRDLGLPRAILFNTGNTDINDDSLSDEIAALVAAMAPAPVVILANNHELPEVLHIIKLGVRGYIPSSVSIDVCIQAIAVAIAGGRFVPASSLLNMRKSLGIAKIARPVVTSSFTSRQSAVAEALRCGKANKVIASELNLCESTIKVHIRNIMKKLGATNRTEVACKIGDLATRESLY